MANVNQGQSYESPFKLIIGGILIVIIVIFIIDFIYGKVSVSRFTEYSKEIFNEALSVESNDTVDKLKEYIQKGYDKKGFDTSRLSLVEYEDYYLLINYDTYLSIVGSATYGLIGSQNKMVSTSLKGYYNEYHEPVIEEYENDFEEVDDDIVIPIK